jgi:hypothetical protein
MASITVAQSGTTVARDMRARQWVRTADRPERAGRRRTEVEVGTALVGVGVVVAIGLTRTWSMDGLDFPGRPAQVEPSSPDPRAGHSRAGVSAGRRDGQCWHDSAP